MIIRTVIAAGTALAAAAAHAQPPLSFADVFSLEMAADPQISPDGATVVYSAAPTTS